MENGPLFALGWLFGLCFALFALAFSGPLTYCLAKRFNFFRRVRRQRLMDDYARFLWMVKASSFEDYLKIRNEAYLSSSYPLPPLSEVLKMGRFRRKARRIGKRSRPK